MARPLRVVGRRVVADVLRARQARRARRPAVHARREDGVEEAPLRPRVARADRVVALRVGVVRAAVAGGGVAIERELFHGVSPRVGRVQCGALPSRARSAPCCRIRPHERENTAARPRGSPFLDALSGGPHTGPLALNRRRAVQNEGGLPPLAVLGASRLRAAVPPKSAAVAASGGDPRRAQRSPHRRAALRALKAVGPLGGRASRGLNAASRVPGERCATEAPGRCCRPVEKVIHRAAARFDASVGRCAPCSKALSLFRAVLAPALASNRSRRSLDHLLRRRATCLWGRRAPGMSAVRPAYASTLLTSSAGTATACNLPRRTRNDERTSPRRAGWAMATRSHAHARLREPRLREAREPPTPARVAHVTALALLPLRAAVMVAGRRDRPWRGDHRGVVRGATPCRFANPFARARTSACRAACGLLKRVAMRTHTILS
jgi:hypothetical protein